MSGQCNVLDDKRTVRSVHTHCMHVCMQCVIRDARCTVCNCNQKYTAEHSQHVNMLHLQVWASVAHCRAYSVGTLPLASVAHAVQCFHEGGSWRPLSARW